MVYQSLMQRPLTDAEALAAERVTLHPALSRSDASTSPAASLTCAGLSYHNHS